MAWRPMEFIAGVWFGHKEFKQAQGEVQKPCGEEIL